jgi:outer membrane receptor protein involved in Fe transport
LRLGAVNRVHGLPTVVAEPEDAPPELARAATVPAFNTPSGSGPSAIARDWDLHLAHARQELLYRNDEPTREDGGDDDVLRFEALGQWDITEARLAGPLNDDHELMLGLEHQRDRQQRLRYFYVSQPDDGNTFRGRRTGVFVQDSWTLAPRQRLLLGCAMTVDRMVAAATHAWPTAGRMTQAASSS